MGKENFVGRSVLKQFFRESLLKMFDDGKDTRTFLSVRKSKDQELLTPRILLFYGENGLGKTTALNQCVSIAQDFAEETKKQIKIIKIDWEDWFQKKMSLPSSRNELLNALYLLLSDKNLGLSNYFNRFDDLQNKINKINSRVEELIRDEWSREPQKLSVDESQKNDQLKQWLQKKLSKQDLELLEKADLKLAEILINGLDELSVEVPILLTIDNYELIDPALEIWFRQDIFSRLFDQKNRILTIISGCNTNFVRGYRNDFPEEFLHIVNFNDITFTKNDITRIASELHVSLTETDVFNLEQFTAGIPLVIQDILSYSQQEIPINELITPETVSDLNNAPQLIAGIVERFRKYNTDQITRERIFHLSMLHQYDLKELAKLWNIIPTDVNNVFTTISNRYVFIKDRKIHTSVRSYFNAFLHQELSKGSDSSLYQFFREFSTNCSQLFFEELELLHSTIQSPAKRYTDEKYRVTLINYFGSLMWATPQDAFNCLPGYYLELLNFNPVLANQLLWYLGEFRAAMSENQTKTLELLYNGILLSDQSLVKDLVAVQESEQAVIDYLDSYREYMSDFQQALLFHKQGELKLRLNLPDDAMTDIDSALSLLGENSPERTLLYNDYIILSRLFSASSDREKSIRALKNALSIKDSDFNTWYELGCSCLNQLDFENAVIALSKSVSINPDNQDTWYHLGTAYSALGKHGDAVQAFTKTIEKGPENRDVLFELGKSYNILQQHENASKAFQKVVDIAPDDVNAWYLKGCVSSTLGQSQDAIDAFGNAVRIKPDFIDALKGLGTELQLTGIFKEAAEVLEKAAALDPKDNQIWVSIANAWFSSDNYLKTIEAGKKAIEINNDDFTSWTLIGHAYTALGIFTDANDAYNKAAVLTPENPSIWINLGNNFYAQSEYSNAVEAFKKAVTIDPKQEGTWFNLGLAYRVQEQNDNALDAFKSAVENEPGNAECWHQKGRVHMSLEQYHDAVVCFTKTVEISADSHDAWYRRGLACAKTGDHQEAIKSFVQASELWSSDPDIWYNLGLAYAHIADHEQAANAFTEASKLTASKQEIWFNLGLSQYFLGQYVNAINAFTKSIEISNDHGLSYNYKGNCEYYLQKYSDAQDSLLSAVTLLPENMDILFILALTYYAQGNYEEAINTYTSITDKKPESVDAWYNMALAYDATGNFIKSIEIYNIIVTKWPDNCDAWYNMGFAYHSVNDFNSAIKVYREASRINPARVDIWYNLGIAFYTLEHFGEAIQAYRKVINLAPDHYDALFNLGMAYTNWGDHNDAVESYSKAVRIKPDQLSAWENLTIACFEAENFEKTIENGNKALELNNDNVVILSYVIVSNVITGKLSKASEVIDLLIAIDTSCEGMKRTLYFLNKAFQKNPAIQGIQEIIQKLESAQQSAEAIDLIEQ